ncbi:MBL fold metallo-hydrolase [Patescibacteria group bacterium]
MAVRYKRMVVGQLKANCYLLFDEKAKSAVIIDPGDDADHIQKAISDNELIVKAIIATHGHFDHIMAALELKLVYNVPFLASRKDESLIKRVDSTSLYFTNVKSDPPPTIDVDLDKEKNISFNGIKLEIIRTPGHTPGGVSFYIRKERLLIVGDVVFKDGVGRTDFKYSNTKNNQLSIKKLLSYPSDTIILSGHGDETTVGEIKSTMKLSIDS